MIKYGLQALSILLLLCVIAIYEMWLRLLIPSSFDLQLSPMFMIAIVACITIVAALLIFRLLTNRSMIRKNRWIITNIVSVVLVIVFALVAPVTVFADYTVELLKDHYQLTDVKKVCDGRSSSSSFVRDDDYSIDTEAVRNAYGQTDLMWIQGVREIDGEKEVVLILCNDQSYKPLNTATVFKLSSSYNIDLKSNEQGYKENEFPIQAILTCPVLSND